MRIVAGEFRGRKLHAPRGQDIRPTTDRVKEAVFSMVAPRIPGAAVLDLFAGSGALGLEALSRGADRVVFVDRSPRAIELVKANVALCGVEDRCRVILGAGEQIVKRLAADGERFHLFFLDPPYGKGHVEEALSLLGALTHPDGMVIAECHVKDEPPKRCGGWVRIKERRYGDTLIAVFVRETSDCGLGCCEG